MQRAANVAVTDWAALMVTAQVAVPVQAPDQPLKTERGVAAAVSVNAVPCLKVCTQAAPQLMPAGLEVTAPSPFPAFVSVSALSDSNVAVTARSEPIATEQVPAPELAARYPLAMISPPARHFLNSTFVNVKSLRDIEAEPVVEIHAEDASARGLSDGQTVRVFNDRGSYHCTARISPRARPGVVNGLGVWWRKLGRNGTNVNELTHQRLTDLGAAPSFYDCLVEVAPL